MMNKLVLFILCLPVLLSAQDVTIRVIDESGNPIEGAEVVAYYDRGNNPIPSQKRTGETDEEGIFKCSGSAIIGLSFWVKSEGYYDHGYQPAESDEIHKFPKSLEKVIQLREVRNPIALYGKQTTPQRHGERRLIVENFSEWLGYDLEVGDLVSPYGSGKTTDLLLRFDREFVGLKDSRHSIEVLREAVKGKYERLGKEFNEDVFKLETGKWDMRLEIAFPNGKEGLLQVVEGFKPHSVLRMPHEAPENGYQSSHAYTVTNYKQSSLRDDIGFFLRTRVVLDEDGEIESANYAKVHGDFRITVDGKVSFTYYFNPTPNDRNLEFDPKQNLFPEGAPGTFNFVLP